MELHVVDIQRFCVQDGPGIRTTVFLKGCGLRCKWCHNPESVGTKDTLLYYDEKCILCGNCVKVCTQGVHLFASSCAEASENDASGDRMLHFGGGSVHLLRREQCTACGRCIENCPTKALDLAGRTMTEETLLKKLLRDRAFYAQTGGGITFSGGEPLLQIRALAPLMEKCKEYGLHIAVETAAYVPWASFELLLPYVDLWLCDVKAVTEDIFQAGCGGNVSVVLENQKKLANVLAGCRNDANRAHASCVSAAYRSQSLPLQVSTPKMWVRTPLIPGFNNSINELKKIREWIDSLGNVIDRVEILPYHDTAKSKYRAMGKSYELETVDLPPKDSIQMAAEILKAQISY